MPTIAEVRQKYPQYEDLSDEQLADALHRKFYSDMPKEEFQAKIGMETAAPSEPDTARPDMMSDVLKSAGAGLVRGASGIAGLPGDLDRLLGAGLDWTGQKTGIDQHPSWNTFKKIAIGPETPDSQDVISAVEKNVTGPLHEPQTTAGKYARTVGEFAPAIVAGPGGVVRRAVTQVAAPALGSEAAGQLTEGTSAEPYARLAGAIAGGAGAATASRVVTPFPVSADRQKMVETLRKEGVQPTAGQATGRKSLQYLESELGGGATARKLDTQQDQFTAAILRRVGETATRATLEVVDQAFTRIGREFDNLAIKNNVKFDAQFGKDVGAAVRDYDQLVPSSQQAPAVQNIVKDILDRINQGKGTMPGGAYASLRSRLDKMARKARTDPNLSEALFGIRSALDDAMERSLTASGRTDDIVRWREARSQYRNMLVVETAATGAGEGAAMGAISPAKLRQSAVGQNKRSYVRGKGDFSDLAHAGQAIMTPLPNSGTAGRVAAHTIPALGGGMLTGGIDGGIGFLAGAVAPTAVGRIAMTPWAQKYLANQKFPNTGNVGATAARAALIETLVGPRMIGAQPASQ
jgi:hypothetical protein